MEENTRTIAYSQHYRSAQEFIGTPADQVVFQYIWDEWLCRYRQGKSTTFKLSIKRIALKRQMHRNTVRNSLDKLVERKLILLDGEDMCELNISRFMTMVNVYESLDVEKRIEFGNAVKNNDDDALEEFGCAWNLEDLELISEMNGSLYKNVQGCTNLYRDAQKCTGQNEENEAKPVQKCTGVHKNVQGLAENFVELLKENFSTETLYDEVSPFLEGVMDKETALECIERLFLDENMYKNVHPDYLPIILALGCTKMYRGVYKNVQDEPEKCTKMYTSKRNINKENKVASQWEMENEIEDELDENFPDDSEKEEEVDSQVGEVNLAAFDALNSRYEKIRKRRRLPFIPVREVEEAIKNLPAFLDRPEMIFINQLWEILSELFVGETLNDQDEWVEVKLDPEGMTIPTNRLMQDLLIPAYEATKQILDSGKFYYKGDELPVSSDKKFEPEDLELLIDWQLSSDKDGRHYVISKARFKNIYSQEVEEKNRRLSVREGREQDKNYMRQIIKLGDNEEDYDKLTDIELVAYNFLVENFDISEDFQTFSPKFPYINHLGLTRFYHTFRGSTVTPQDFLGILYKNAPDRNDGSLILKPRTFSAQAIIEWNQKHTQISAIVPLDE